MHSRKSWSYLPWLACLGVVAFGATAWAVGGQEVNFAVIDGAGQLVTDASLELTDSNGTAQKATFGTDGTLYIKSASGKVTLIVHHAELGSATAELALPLDPEVLVVVQMDGGFAEAWAVTGEKFPTSHNTIVRPASTTSAQSDISAAPFVKQPDRPGDQEAAGSPHGQRQGQSGRLGRGCQTWKHDH